jgi:hypothetical protein
MSLRINSSKLELFNQIKKFTANIFSLRLGIFTEKREHELGNNKINSK